MFHYCSEYTTSFYHRLPYFHTSIAVHVLNHASQCKLHIFYWSCTAITSPAALKWFPVFPRLLCMHVLHPAIRLLVSTSMFFLHFESRHPLDTTLMFARIKSNRQESTLEKLNPTFLINTYMLRKTPTPNSIADKKKSRVYVYPSYTCSSNSIHYAKPNAPKRRFMYCAFSRKKKRLQK